MKDDRAYLEYIVQCIAKIEQYSQNGKKDFLTNSLVQDAVLRRLQTLAESTQRLSPEIKADMPNIDWRSISGFRNVLVHDYLGGVDLEIAWQVVEKYLPHLRNEVSQALHKIS